MQLLFQFIISFEGSILIEMQRKQVEDANQSTAAN